DGIRDFHVTGVQTCALPISLHPTSSSHSSIDEELMELRQANETNRILMEGEAKGRAYLCFGVTDVRYLEDLIYRYYDSGMKIFRSEERRVGKEGRSRGSQRQ